MYVVWKQRAVVFWKPFGNTEVTTACRLRRHKIQRKSMALLAPIVYCEHFHVFLSLPLQFNYYSFSQQVQAVALGLQ